MIDSNHFHIDSDPQLFVDDVLIEAAQDLTRCWPRRRNHERKPHRQPEALIMAIRFYDK